MSVTASSVSRVLRSRFPANSKGVAPYAVRKDGYRIVVFSSTHSLDPAEKFLREKGFGLQRVDKDYLLVWR